MGRHKLVVLLSAIVMMLIGAAVVAFLLIATQSDGGRAWIGRQITRVLAGGVKGKLYLGKMSGSFLTDFAVDSALITDPDDSVFIATGPVHVTFDPRDLIDGRILLRSVDVQHPFINIRHNFDGVWNLDKVFPPSKQQQTPSEPLTRSAWGAVVAFRNVRVRDLNFQLTQPWTPNDSLKGTHRDSAIVHALSSKDQDVRAVTVKGVRRFQQTMHWTEGNWTFTRIRLRDPLRPGRQFDIARFDVNESSPPFSIRNMRGHALWRGDSIWLDIARLELPASVARVTGRLDWGGKQSLHWDLRIHSDTMGLSDIAWVAPAIPRTGGGSMDLHVKTDRDERVMNYVITNMNLRTTASHMLGAMSFSVGGPVLVMKDVNLRLEPVDFAFFEGMNGGPFPQPWHGTFTGTLVARGGPINHFMVDALKLTYADRNVAGATSVFDGTGEIDILTPANAKFHGFHLNLARLDLRTPQYLSPGFPRLNGTLFGEATLDSIWTDVRFRDADITHRDGDSTPPSHFKGDVRLTTSTANVGFDVSVAALPISFTTLAHADTALHVPLRGEWTGPLRLQGDITDFSVTTDLVSDAGRIQLDGLFDASAPGYRMDMRGSVASLDLHQVLAKPNAPVTTLNGRFVTALTLDSLANLQGDAQFYVDRSVVDGVRVYSGQSKMRFAAGAMQLDTLDVQSGAGALSAHGGLGLSPARRDSLQFRLDVDSLGGLRRYLVKATPPRDTSASAARVDTGAVTRAAALADSLGGAFTSTGTIAGNITQFTLHAKADGTDIRYAGNTVRAATATLNLGLLPDSAAGVVTLAMDTVRIGNFAYSKVVVRDTLMARDHQLVTALVKSQLDSARARADIRFVGDSTAVRLDSLSIQTSADSWSLRRPAALSIIKGSYAVDSLVLSSKTGGLLSLSGRTNADSAVGLTIHTDSVPLADIGELMQVQTPFEGMLSLAAQVKGTRQNPTMTFDGILRHGLLLNLRLDELRASGSYADRLLNTSLVYSRAGLPALHGTGLLPVDLAFDVAGPRLIEAPIKASLHTDSAGMAVLEALSKSITKTSGSLALDLDIAGTWQHPLLNGALVIHDGAMSAEQLGNVKLTALEANVGFHGDSIAGTVTAHSGKTKPSTGELSGRIGIRDLSKPTYDLKFSAQSFNVIDRPKFATLDLTGNLALVGSSDAATLTGGLTADRGSIAIPELFSKHVISLDDPEFYNVVDTTAFEDRHLLPTPPNAIMNNLTVNDVRVQMGKDMWLRSSEANINLGGEVTIQRAISLRGATLGRPQFTLDGTLQAVRGTYKLKLGLVSRTFAVQNGDVRFFGDQDLNGVLNVNAEYTVRQATTQGAKPDVHVDVHLGGTLLTPTATLSSPDSSRGVSQADLVSYLATGQPSNQIGGAQSDYASTAVNVVLSSVASSQFGAAATGGLCDDAQLSTAGLDQYVGLASRSTLGGVLSGARFNCARQVGERVFIRLNAGLCQVGQLVGGGGSSDPLTFADAIGVSVDYQLDHSYTLTGGIDPPTSAVLCSRDASARGFAPTPRQFGLDLFRIWRF